MTNSNMWTSEVVLLLSIHAEVVRPRIVGIPDVVNPRDVRAGDDVQGMCGGCACVTLGLTTVTHPRPTTAATCLILADTTFLNHASTCLTRPSAQRDRLTSPYAPTASAHTPTITRVLADASPRALTQLGSFDQASANPHGMAKCASHSTTGAQRRLGTIGRRWRTDGL